MSAGAKFQIGFASGIAALILGLTVVFAGLDQVNRLKAPAFANRLSFDEKLRYLREHGLDHPEVLLVGSSTTLHGLDGEVLSNQLDLTGGVINLGVQDLRVNQVRFLTDVFLSLFDQVHLVVMVSTTLDFKNCRDADARFFNPEHVKNYLSGSAPELFYQFKYLDLRGVFGRAGQIRHLRSTRDDLESVSFDAHGSLLLDVPRERINSRVWRGDPITLDPACYDSLQGLAENLRDAAIQFTYVIAPMRPGYLADRDPGGSLLAEHRQRLRAHLAGTGAIVIDAHAALDMPEEAFFDAYHLNRNDARRFSRYVGEQIAELADKRRRDQLVAPEASPSGSTAATDHRGSGAALLTQQDR